MHKSLKLMSNNTDSSSKIPSGSSNSEAKAILPTKKSTVATAIPEIKTRKNAKKITQETKILRQAQDESRKKIETKKAVKVEPKVEEKVKPVPEKPKEIQKQIISENIHANPTIHTDPSASSGVNAQPARRSLSEGWVEVQNIMYIGQQEMDSLQMQNFIEQEMAQHWSPPAGMRKDISCIIKVLIGFDGAISKIEIEQPSGVLIFDGAAKRAASQMAPAQWAYGKEIVLTFKP
jgi:outer membrane biosynthesis protein TonB